VRFALVALVLCSLVPQRAEAWADATVRSASARVSVDERAHAHVTIDATLRIDGGWLEAFELDGLDPGLVLDPLDPVTMAAAPSADPLESDAPGEPLAPAVSLRDDGVVVLAFTRRRAPRRGDYVVHLAYDADLSARAHAEPDGAHVDWTFPAWRHGLDSVRVELIVPIGVHPVLGSDDEIEAVRLDDGVRTTWTLTRAHLARTREWPIDLAFPEGVLAFQIALPTVEPSSAAVAPAEAPRPPWQGALLLAVASLFVALRIVRGPVVERRERIVRRAWVPGGSALRALMAVALGAALMGVALVGEDARWIAGLALALVMLGLSRGRPTYAAPKMGSFRNATLTIRRSARRARLAHHLGLDAWLDASTPAGALVVTSFGALVLCAPRPVLGTALVALAIVVTLALDDVRLARPELALVSLSRLLGLARRTRLSLDRPPIALMPVVHLDVSGHAQEARLRVLASLPDGTLRADVVVARTGPFGARYALLVVVARGCPLDEALALDPRFETVAVGNARIARVTPIDRSGIDGAIARVIGAAPLASAAEPAPATTIAA
jgi:hypothetical protein